MVCSNCWFVGDLIQLFAVTKKYSLDGAITVLSSRGALDISDIEKSAYLLAHEQQTKLHELIMTQSRSLATQAYGSVQAMLATYNCRFQAADLIALTPHVIPLHREQLDACELDYPKTAKDVLKWWGMYMALAIPCYDTIRVVGFWLITPSGSNYLPLTESATTSTGMALASRCSDPLSFVVDDPIQALRLSIWSIVHSGRPMAFHVPYGSRSGVASYKSQSAVYWSPAQTMAWFFRALAEPNSKTLLASGLAKGYNPKVDLPCDGSFSQFLKYVDTYAQPSHRALVSHLLSLTTEQARAALHGQAIEPSDKHKCLSYVNGDNAKRVSDLFEAHVQVHTITWNGSVITETEQGWVCKEKVISAAVLHMEEIRPIGTSGDAWITGTVTYNRVSYPFRERYSVIKKRPGAWVQQQIISQSGQIPYVERLWASKLVEIAQQFHTPKAVMTGAPYGWADDTLQLPNFAVEARGILPTKATVEGPTLLLPSPLTETEQAALRDPSLAKLYLLLLGGLIQSRRGQTPRGILAVDSHSLLPRLVDALGAEVVTGQSRSDIVRKGIRPVPPVTLDTDLGDLFSDSSPVHVMAYASKATAELAMAFQSWVSVEFKGPVDLRVLRGIFLDLPDVLTAKPTSDATLYRDLAKVMSTKYGLGGMFRRAADLDLLSYNQRESRPAQITEFLVRLSRRGVLATIEKEDEVQVPIAPLYTYAKRHGVPLPPVGELTDTLSKGGALIGSDPSYWVYSPYAWGFYRSFSTGTP